MKRLLLVALMVMMGLVGTVGVSGAGSEVSALQATAKKTDGAVTELPATGNAGDEYSPYYDPDKGAVIEPATVNAGVPAKRKMYYLTVTSFTGGEAITACDSGFHMASLSEIQDPSKVQYAPNRTTAYDSKHDSPPSDQASDQFPDHTGWVRTEADPLTGPVYNCDAWRSSSDQQSGTTMTRRSLWGEKNGHSLYEESDPAAWWQSTRAVSCSQPEPVWCIKNTD